MGWAYLAACYVTYRIRLTSVTSTGNKAAAKRVGRGGFRPLPEFSGGLLGFAKASPG